MQTNLEQKEQSQRQHTIQLQNALKSYHHQNSMELAFKKKKKDSYTREPRNKPTNLQSNDFLQGAKNTYLAKDTHS